MIDATKKYIGSVFAAMAAAVMVFAGTANARAAGVRVHCKEDTVKVGALLRKAAGEGGNFGKRCVIVAEALASTPWKAAPDNDSIGTLVVDLHGFDRLGFINNVLAIANASLRRMPVEREYEIQLENYSRRKGEDDGFASQLIYGADWVVDNIYRGNLKEMTEYVGGGGFKPKTLDYISRHADEYPAMKNPDTKDKIRMVEMGYRSHRIPHLKKQSAANKEIHDLMDDGDIVMLLSPEPDFDIYDIGFVKMEGGEPHLIHISRETGTVVVDPYPLSRLFKLEGQHFYGYRWLRPTE